MIIAFIFLTVLSAVWLFLAGGAHGSFGIHIKRRITLRVDKKVDRDLARVIARYNSGELTLQESKYGKNLLFSKMVKVNDNIDYAESNYYVNIEHPDKLSFGRITDCPMSSWIIREACTGGAISNGTFDDLNEIIKECFPDDNDTNVQKKRWFRKFKKEEVHLS